VLRCARHLLANVLTRVRVTVRDGLVLRVMSVVRSVIGVMHVGRVRGMELRHQGLHDLLLQHLMRTVMVRDVMMCVAMVMSVSVVMRWVVRHVMVSVVVTVMVHVRSWIARSSRGELLLLRISEGRTTRGTEVTVLIHALETRAVHGVTTGQERNGLATVEHPLLGGTARTLGLESNVHLALVRVFDFDRQAHATLVAVPVVNVQTLAHATYAAVVAVVDALALLIVPQLAHLAVVVRYLPPAVLVRAHLTHGLDRVALHAHHLLGRVAINLVRGDIVVTQPTREELVATVSQDLATSLVVLAAKMKFLFVLIGRRKILLRQGDESLLPMRAIDDGRVLEVDQHVHAQLQARQTAPYYILFSGAIPLLAHQ
jgi:hypothetical protein